jgi:syringomycin synthetase protein SyrB1
MNDKAVTAPEKGAVITGTESSVLAIVEEVLGRRGIGLDGDLFDHGATSLSFVRVLGQIHQRLNAVVHPAELGDSATVRRMAACVDRDRSPSAAQSIGA